MTGGTGLSILGICTVFYLLGRHLRRKFLEDMKELGIDLTDDPDDWN